SRNAFGNSLLCDTAVITVTPPSAAAVFVSSNETRQGDWIGFFGLDGFAIPGDTSQFSDSVHVGEDLPSEYVWSPYPLSKPALMRHHGDRIASTWFDDEQLSFDVSLR